MIKSLFVIILFLIFTVKAGISQNILAMRDASCLPGDTVILSMEINNQDKFISFQFDMQLPDNVSFSGYSIGLTARSANHVAIGNMVGTNLLRVFSYSPNNAAFSGNSGVILTLKLVTGAIRGAFPLPLSNAIIGDSLSKNIITGTQNGVLSVYPLSVRPVPAPNGLKFKLYPNPCKERLFMDVILSEESELTMVVKDMAGKSVASCYLGDFNPGFTKIQIPEYATTILADNQVYQFLLMASTNTGKSAHSSEMIVNKY